MQKHLLLAASLMLASGAAMAQLPMALPETILTAVSPDGKIAAGSNIFTGGVDVVDLTTGNVDSYSDEDSEDSMWEIPTNPNCISNTGIVLLSLSYDGIAAYVENGEVHVLPIPEGITSSFTSAITADGSRIFGSVGVGMSLEYKGTMQAPAIWERNAEGTYDEAIILPFPKDFSGRAPQYAMPCAISLDGSVMALQTTDDTGMICQNFVYTTDAEGNWTYKELGASLINPDGIEFPEYVEMPEMVDFMTPENRAAFEAAEAEAETLVQPQPTDFMTPENSEAYTAAMDAYWETFENYPNMEDYMTEEEYAAYQTASDEYLAKKYPSARDYMTEEEIDAYENACAEWQEKNAAFDDALYQVIGSAVQFEMNQVCMSPDGKYVGVAGNKMDPDTWESTMSGYIFTVASGNYSVLKTEEATIIPTAIGENGQVIAVKPFSRGEGTPGKTFYTPHFNAPLQALEAYVETKDAETYDWMTENMFHTYITWDYETGEDVEVSEYITGQGIANSDFSVIVMWTIDTWGGDTSTESYAIPFGEPSGVEGVNAETVNAPVEYFNLQGIRINRPTEGSLVIRRQGEEAVKTFIR